MMPEQGEHYVAVPVAVLQAIRALWCEQDAELVSVGTVKLLLQAVRLDEVSGTLVISIKATRDL